MQGVSINPEADLLQISRLMRVVDQARSTGMERLSNGTRVNRGGDDPSGLAIGSGMRGQLRGIDTAIINLTEGMDMLHAADSVLGEVQDIFMRIRDLCVKGLNQATLTNVVGTPGSDPMSDTRQIFREILTLQVEVYRTATGVTLNGKQAFHDFSAPDGQVLQIGANNSEYNQITIEIPDLEGMGVPFYTPPPGNITSQQFNAAFKAALENVDARLETLSDTRANLGAQEKRLLGHLEDLSVQKINVSSSKSQIMDADMAGEYVGFTRSNITANFAGMAYSHSNVDPGMVYELLNAVGLR